MVGLVYAEGCPRQGLDAPSSLWQRRRTAGLLLQRDLELRPGEQLAISPKTVDTYKQRVNDKLGMTHRADYVKLALKLGLLQAPAG